MNGSRFQGSKSIVRVFIVEPSQQVAGAIREIMAIDGHLQIVGESHCVDAPDIGNLRPDVIILDLDNLAMSIESAIATCDALAPQSRVLVISVHSRTRTMQRVLAARAAAYVIKDIQPTHFVDIIRSVAGGESYADPRLAGLLLRRSSARVPRKNILSNREVEIVRLIAEGLSNRQIGSRVALSEKTIKNHVSHILSKLQIPARTGVAVYALRNGLVR